MDESRITVGPFKGKKRKMVSLTSCQTGPLSQDARDVIHVSVVTIVSLSLNSLLPLFSTFSDLAFKDAELCRVLGDADDRGEAFA
jgi:hypothetical protein